MTFRLTILGCNSALPSVDKYPSAHVLNVCEQFFLIDAGEGVQSQLRRYGVSPLKINEIFISHLHGDHCYGLFGLISTMGLLGRQRALNIYAPSPIGEIIDNHIRFFEPHLSYKIEVHEVDCSKSEMIFENNAVEVITVPLFHRVPTVGYIFREKPAKLNIRKELIEELELSVKDIIAAKEGLDVVLPSGRVVSNSELTYQSHTPRSFAYCSDTSFNRSVVEAVRGVDLLYHEATYLHADVMMARRTGHSTATLAGVVARDAAVERLVIGHFSQRYNGDIAPFLTQAREIFPNTDLAVEGLSFDIPLVRQQ